MLLAHLEQPALQEDVARQIGTRPWGTPASNILKLVTWGMRVYYGTGSLASLESRLEAGIPPIVFVRTSELPYWQEDTPHAVIVVGMDADNVFLLDPAYQDEIPVTVSLGNFALAWSHSDQAMALIEKA
jgi:hypothetical protein